MKTIYLVLALLAATASPALSATLADLNNAEFGLDQASPNMMAKHLLGTKLIKESMRSVELKYVFANQGGSVGTISLVNARTGLPATLPKNAIIRNCVIDVTSSPTSGGSATIAFTTGQGAGDLKTATAYGSLTSGLYACVPVGSAATAIKLTADSSPSIAVAVAALTAGEIHVILDYSLSL